MDVPAAASDPAVQACYMAMAAIMVGGMVPPVGIAIACKLFPKKFTQAERGSALSNIVSSLGMDPKNGITFGDQYNDLEMLQLSNTSYAMTTAATGVADYATHTTDSVEKTLWEFLQTL